MGKSVGASLIDPHKGEWQHVVAHELGHNLGLMHSSGAYNHVYDSWWDLMGGCADHKKPDSYYGPIAIEPLALGAWPGASGSAMRAPSLRP